MTDPVSLPFEMNQQQLTAAIVGYLPKVADQLSVDFTNGRAPRGLTAAVGLTEDQIREAVIEHAKRQVNPSFRHFSISFKATRGDDGLTTSIIASTHPIAPESPAEAPVAAAVAQPAKAAEAPVDPAPTPAAEAPVADKGDPEAEKAPWEDTAASAEVDTPETTGAEEATASEAVATDTAEAAPAEAPAPATGRSKLFGDLTRPQND